MTKTPHPVDVHVGKRIRKVRWLKNITQSDLAGAVGIKFQQIQKYETGANRVSASRLWDIANVLNVDVAYFFEGLTSNGSAGGADLGVDPDPKDLRLIGKIKAMPEHQADAVRAFVASL